MHAALERTFIQTNFGEHRADGVDVHCLAAVRAAGDRDFPFGKAKTFCRARNDHWDSLKRFSGGTYVSNGLGQTQRGDSVPPAVDRG